MLHQIIVGLLIIVLSIVIQAIFMEIASRQFYSKHGSYHPSKTSFKRYVLTVSSVTLWLSIGLLCIVLMWTALFIKLAVFSEWEHSFYFSLVAFTTLGFGDVILPEKWRILSGFIAMDGFLLFGLNTAVLLEVMIRLRGDTEHV